MNSAQPKHVTIVGVGLLGGSLGLALKQRYKGVTVAGVGRRQASLDVALRAKTIDTAHLDAAECVGQSDLVVLATPVCAFAGHLKHIVPHLKRGALVTDVGSTKAEVVRIGEKLCGRGGAFVGSHPMAGSEKKGAQFARADLFEGATCCVTPTKHTPPALLKRTEKLWRDVGMNVVRMTPVGHDTAVARVSHLPHALAGLLMMLPGKKDMPLAATGFADMTRLAAGDPEMWRDIFVTNRKAILAAMDKFEDTMMHLRDLLELSDAAGLEKFFAVAQKAKDQSP